MKVLGIVGHAQEKFTHDTEAMAREAIREEIASYKPTVICSGHSPMGGVDIYAEEIAKELGLATVICAPTRNRWDGPGGFKARNLEIARVSDLVLVVVIAPHLLPAGVRDYGNGRCYHCDRYSKLPVIPHIKSGGCWTAWQARDRKWRIVSSCAALAADVAGCGRVLSPVPTAPSRPK